MQALVAGEIVPHTLQWLMAFVNVRLMERLVPEELHYHGYSEYPEEGCYPFTSMGDERLSKELGFNLHIDRCVFPVGWGANAAFGHAGPGEFNTRVIEKHDAYMVVQYETGAKKEIRFRPHNVKIFDLPVKQESDLERLELPEPADSKRYDGFAEDVAWAKAHGEWTIGWVNGFFSGVHYFLRDYAQFLMDLMLNPDFARALIEKLGNWTLCAAEKMCEAGVDCIGFCDDLGSEQATLFRPELYREFFWPWHKKLCDLAHSFDALVHMHSHGAILPILPDIAAAGIDILNPLDPDEHMRMAEVREALGPNVVLCGGMNKHFFDWAKDEQVAHLRQVVASGREYGPHILMDSGGIPDSVTRPWFEWFLETSREIRAS